MAGLWKWARAIVGLDPAPRVPPVGVSDMRKWAALAPPRAGPLKDGTVADALGAGQTVLLMVDDRGRVFELVPKDRSGGGVHISGANLIQMGKPRQAIEQLFERFGVEDVPDMFIDPRKAG